MKGTPRLLLLAVPALLAGCVGHDDGSTASSSSQGMSMPSGAAAAPPETATMVCGGEIRTKVKQVLSLPVEPATSSTWAHSVFTCTYALPQGTMTLAVQVLPSSARAAMKLDADRTATTGAQSLAGLGERAWGTDAGTAAVLKDDQILTVDTTRLPEVFGANDQKRTDLAYEVASDVLGCWTGDGDE